MSTKIAVIQFFKFFKHERFLYPKKYNFRLEGKIAKTAQVGFTYFIKDINGEKAYIKVVDIIKVTDEQAQKYQLLQPIFKNKHHKAVSKIQSEAQHLVQKNNQSTKLQTQNTKQKIKISVKNIRKNRS